MAKALYSEKPPVVLAARKQAQLKIQLSPGELRVYIHFIRGSLRDNPAGKSVLRALVAAKKGERKRVR